MKNLNFEAFKKNFNTFLDESLMNGDYIFYSPDAWEERGEGGVGGEAIAVVTCEGGALVTALNRYDVMGSFKKADEMREKLDAWFSSQGIWFEMINHWSFVVNGSKH